jgi:UDP-N-acetylmuramyl tripeptide synthase
MLHPAANGSPSATTRGCDLMPSPRRTAAIVAARTAAGLSRRLRFGGGTALPGLVAERLDPGIVPALASQLGQGSVLVTGTNGKTTTSRLLRSIVEAAGLTPVANREGSNMMRGVAAALAEAADWDGRMRRRKKRIGVFEVDEATMPQVARAVRPRVVTFTNLFRDQLDRYGEVETVAAIWGEAVAAFPADVTLVLNADDPAVAALREQARGPVVLYGLDDVTQATGEIEHAADARWCTKCGAELEYDAVFYGHIGHWRCPSCGNTRPTPDVRITSIDQTAHGPKLSIAGPEWKVSVHLAQPGTYNVYNALAAAATASALSLGPSAIGPGLLNATAAFGRQEIIEIDGRDVHVILAKNPAGLNQVLRTLPDGDLDLALFLNDDIADGRDISWIWDVDFELLAGRARSVTASGRRAWDMALRLKYAGVSEKPRVANNIATALRKAINETPEEGELYAIPTYTAMLEVRNVLGKWAGRGKFWEGDAK